MADKQNRASSRSFWINNAIIDSAFVILAIYVFASYGTTTGLLALVIAGLVIGCDIVQYQRR